MAKQDDWFQIQHIYVRDASTDRTDACTRPPPETKGSN